MVGIEEKKSSKYRLLAYEEEKSIIIIKNEEEKKTEHTKTILRITANDTAHTHTHTDTQQVHRREAMRETYETYRQPILYKYDQNIAKYNGILYAHSTFMCCVSTALPSNVMGHIELGSL